MRTPPLTLLASILSANKSAVLDRALLVEEELVRELDASSSTHELAGELRVTLTAAPEVALDTLEQRLRALLSDLAEKGIDGAQLERMKARFEAGYVRAFETVSGRTRALAEANVFEGDPRGAVGWLERILTVSAEQVHDVLCKYVVGHPAVILSVVPEGRSDMATTSDAPQPPSAEASLDRTQRPPAGPAAQFRTPAIWRSELANGVELLGTLYDEVPLTRIELSIPGGRTSTAIEQAGLPSLAAQLLGEGTERLSTTEWTEALDGLGASLRIASDQAELTFSLSTLDKHLEASVALLTELLLAPRFAPEDFERLRRQRLTAIRTRGDDPRGIAATVFARLLYGPDSILGAPSRGTRETVEGLELAALRAWYTRVADPRRARLVVVGKHDAEAAQRLFAELATHWTAPQQPVEAAQLPTPPAIEGTTVYLVDRPGAPQSELRVGHMGPPRTHEDFYALNVLNYVLGGAFSSRVNMNLREDKGYTYGARTGLFGTRLPGPFRASTGVHTHVTAQAVQALMGELRGILAGPTDAELDFARRAILQANARRYESMRALAELVDNVGRYGFPDDYPERQAEELRELGVDRLRELARRHLDPERMAILVVGDAAEIRSGLAELELGDVVELDIDGEPLPQGE